MLSFEERRSVLDGTIIGIQNFLKWTGINGQTMEKISTFLPVCCRQDYFCKSCLKWERKGKKYCRRCLKPPGCLHFPWGVGGLVERGSLGWKTARSSRKRDAIKQKGYWNESEYGERDWGETRSSQALRAFEACARNLLKKSFKTNLRET